MPRRLSATEATAAGLDDGLTLQLDLAATKPPALHDTDGWIDFGPAGGSYYYSRTAMTASGSLVLGERTLDVDGSGWFDHQWGDFISVGGGGWDWFAVNLDDGTDLTLSLVRDADGSYPLVYGTLVDADGRSRHLSPDAFTVEVTDDWTSPRTGATYPAAWRVSVPGEDLEIELEPTVADQELDTRATTGVIYWEGSQHVRATRGGSNARWRGVRRADRLRRGPGRALTSPQTLSAGLRADPRNTAGMRLELTRRGDYAVRAMLSLAAHNGDGWLSVARISAAMDIPEQFLPRVMTDLVRSGLVEGHLGRAGGYRLARPAMSISLLEVIQAVEPDDGQRTCVLRGGPCGRDGTCAVHGVFTDARTAMLDRLSTARLADLKLARSPTSPSARSRPKKGPNGTFPAAHPFGAFSYQFSTSSFDIEVPFACAPESSSPSRSWLVPRCSPDAAREGADLDLCPERRRRCGRREPAARSCRARSSTARGPRRPPVGRSRSTRSISGLSRPS